MTSPRSVFLKSTVDIRMNEDPNGEGHPIFKLTMFEILKAITKKDVDSRKE
jgi:hypothetical protein